MTEKDLFREIGMIDEKYVEEAENVKRSKILTPVFRRTLATVACLCICVGIYFSVRTVRDESDNAERGYDRNEMMTADGTNFKGESSSAAESFDESEELYESVAGSTNSVSGGAASDMAPEMEDVECSDGAAWDEDPKQTAGVTVESAESIVEELAKYSNDYEMLCNGDAFVVTHGKVSAGMDKWEQFLMEINRGNEAQVDVIRFTEEGDAIITRVCYKNGVYYLLEDSTRDAWGNGTYTTYEFASMNMIKDSEGYVEIIFADIIVMDPESVDSQAMYYLVQYRERD